ncbi:nucleotidyltransferase family protein [Streptomyces bohaiensis]|uniref:NTP transferase domain-containing protein n=1 Tax=Streptomyces bohaiensis TaxID=1431344 RepID=A0ABX1CFM2_9ACTN|nr:NTP transferase domain-containing protein [Streptomyces bohaiensis]NJQ17849.1 NTP transferase domain-containing protein [Streptomyces bohaiensis]
MRDQGSARGRGGRPRAAAPVPFDAVVLAGGAGRRLGGTDKAAVRVGGRTLLDRVLTACRAARGTVVVGPPRPTVRPVLRAREDPPGGGPLAAVAAGLAALGHHPGRPPSPGAPPVVAVLATDLPFLTPELVAAVTDPPDGADAVVPIDADGRDQTLAAGYRVAPLLTALAGIRAEHGRLDGLPLRLLPAALRVHRLATSPNGPVDCDTWADIAAARTRIRDDGRVLEEWLAAVKAELDIDTDVDTGALLDAARDAAHGVTRPAAPLTTYLLGYAAGSAGVDPAEAARRIGALAARWQQEQEQEPGQAPQGAPGAGPGAATEATDAAEGATGR